MNKPPPPPQPSVPPKQPKIFETTLYLNLNPQNNLKKVLIIIINCIYFQRSLGNLIPCTEELFGVVFPIINDKELNKLIEGKVDWFCKSLSNSTIASTTNSTKQKPHRIVLALYPTQIAPPHRSCPPAPPASPSSLPSAPSSSSPYPSSHRPNLKSTSLPLPSQTQTQGTKDNLAGREGTTGIGGGTGLLPNSSSVSNALNWFRDSAKEVLLGHTNTSSPAINTGAGSSGGGGGGGGGRVGSDGENIGYTASRTPSSGSGSGSTKGGRTPDDKEGEEEEEQEEVISEEEIERRIKERNEFGEVWESWVINIFLVDDDQDDSSEEKIKNQLNHFLLRTIMFVNSGINHIPPITNSELQPHGIQILLNPPHLPFKIVRTNDESNEMFPELFKLLTA